MSSHSMYSWTSLVHLDLKSQPYCYILLGNTSHFNAFLLKSNNIYIYILTLYIFLRMTWLLWKWDYKCMYVYVCKRKFVLLYVVLSYYGLLLWITYDGLCYWASVKPLLIIIIGWRFYMYVSNHQDICFFFMSSVV